MPYFGVAKQSIPNQTNAFPLAGESRCPKGCGLGVALPYVFGVRRKSGLARLCVGSFVLNWWGSGQVCAWGCGLLQSMRVATQFCHNLNMPHRPQPLPQLELAPEATSCSSA
eukprot:3869752-Alexandrium_andersonii.AAC.1